MRIIGRIIAGTFREENTEVHEARIRAEVSKIKTEDEVKDRLEDEDEGTTQIIKAKIKIKATKNIANTARTKATP